MEPKNEQQLLSTLAAIDAKLGRMELLLQTLAAAAKLEHPEVSDPQAMKLGSVRRNPGR